MYIGTAVTNFGVSDVVCSFRSQQSHPADQLALMIEEYEVGLISFSKKKKRRTSNLRTDCCYERIGHCLLCLVHCVVVLCCPVDRLSLSFSPSTHVVPSGTRDHAITARHGRCARVLFVIGKAIIPRSSESCIHPSYLFFLFFSTSSV